MKKKKKRVHIKVKNLIVFLAIVLAIASLAFYIVNLKISSIKITGTTYLTDNEIINVASIKDYPKMIKYSSSKLESMIKEIPLVNTVKVKKHLNGKLEIIIDEAKPLFYNRSNNKLVLSNKAEVANLTYYGLPSLINYVPNEIYEEFITSLTKISYDNLYLISEMEYSPSKSGDVTIDDTRFILKMNDGNQVYVNTINIKQLDYYEEIYTTLNDKKGVLYLDSSNKENFYFKEYSSFVTIGSEEEANNE